MEASELKIGNQVESYGTNGNPNSWSSIIATSNHIVTCEQHPEWFRPIKLEKEKLRNYDKTKHSEIYFLSFLSIKPRIKIHLRFVDDKILFCAKNERVETILKQITYVHDFQNLYKELTGNISFDLIAYSIVQKYS